MRKSDFFLKKHIKDIHANGMYKTNSLHNIEKCNVRRNFQKIEHEKTGESRIV